MKVTFVLYDYNLLGTVGVVLGNLIYNGAKRDIWRGVGVSLVYTVLALVVFSVLNGITIDWS